MSENTSEHELKRWKQKYYDHLDLLDKKEKDWDELKSILKKTVLRLSIAAEGQHATIDRHLHNIRAIVKKQVDVIRLENTLDDISALLLKLDDKKAKDDRKVVTMLVSLLENTDFPDTASKQKNKLIKKLAKSSDKYSDELVDEVQTLLSGSINPLAESPHRQTKPGLLSNLFKTQDNTGDKANEPANNSNTSDTSEYISIVNGLTRLTEALPWPGELEKDVDKVLEKLSTCQLRDIDKHLDRLFSLVSEWQQINPNALDDDAISITTEAVSLDAHDMQGHARASDLASSSDNLSEEESEPSTQEIMIRLLEQLAVPHDLLEEVESLKQRIEDESSASGWKQLLVDIAQLINTLRSQMQEEKQEFESFLQQITGRLKEIDSFLLIENASLNEAEQAGDTFDAVVNAQVMDIQDDMKTADDLHDLKSKVEKRLNVVSDHIKQYRISEQERYSNAQENVLHMQSRLELLEQESGNLRKLIIEKNKEAMFDALTEIPNRLSYEKKAAEEIARCNRFATPLSMAVWDVDLFKQINDTYGHKVGDKVLKAIAQLLNERMRATDFIARYGGEEFVMFLTGADETEAFKLADALREKISVCKFNHHGKIIKITVSCGITSFIEGDTHESMFERADKALYAAKHGGRNQCQLASSLQV